MKLILRLLFCKKEDNSNEIVKEVDEVNRINKINRINGFY